MKKLYLFISLILSITSFTTCDDSNSLLKKMLIRTFKGLKHINRAGVIGKVKENTSFANAAILGIKAGVSDAIQFTTKEAISYPLSGIRHVIAFSNSVFWQIIYKISFGANKLNCTTLMLINNHIYTLCAPFAQIKKNKFIDKHNNAKEWDILKVALISELKHACFYIKKALPCYSPLYLQKKHKGNPLTNIFYSFRENNEQISFYMVRTIFYIENLILHIQSLENYSDVIQKSAETRQWLSWVCESFEQTGKFLDQSKVDQSQFHKLDSDPEFSLFNIDNIEE